MQHLLGSSPGQVHIYIYIYIYICNSDFPTENRVLETEQKFTFLDNLSNSTRNIQKLFFPY